MTIKRPQPASDHLNTQEAADMLGLSEATLRDWRHSQVDRQPPYRKIGRYVWYRKSALEAWLKKRDHAQVS